MRFTTLFMMCSVSVSTYTFAADQAAPSPEQSATTREPVSTTVSDSELSVKNKADIAKAKEKARQQQKLLTSSNALDRKLGHMFEANDNPFALTPYEENYILYTYNPDLNNNHYDYLSEEETDELDKHELKFQISLMFPLVRGLAGDNSVLAASYTQMAMWQAFNSEISSPFRETNYEPQIFMAWLSDYEWLGWQLRLTEMGFNHQSNGRSDPRSRSWNRLYTDVTFVKDDWAVSIKPWWRIPENDDDDDNPDITHYLGHYRVKVGYRHDQDTFTSEFRYNWATDRGNIQLGWSHPILNNRLRFYAQIFTGYGETLIDYDNNDTRIGIGVMLNDML